MRILLLICFAVSGVTSLVLEIIWVRLFTQVFGSTTQAIATVLAAFMGGLALGSFFGGRISDRNKINPLVGYAVCEAGIAGFALLVPFVLNFYPVINAWLWSYTGNSLLLIGLRFTLAALLLVPPTVLMGATFPLLIRYWVPITKKDFGGLGKGVGFLYSVNTAGAVVGAACAGFWWLPLLGLSRLTSFVVGTNFLLACFVVVVSLKVAREKIPRVPCDIVTPIQTNSASRLALLAFAISGLVGMVLQVLLSRVFALVLGSSVYSFTLVLVVFLLGLTLGAVLLGIRAARAPDSLEALSKLFVFLAVAILLAHAVIDTAFLI